MQITRYQRILITGLCLLIMLISLGAASQTQTEVHQDGINPDIAAEPPTEPDMAWSKITLTDAVSGEQFTINEISKQGKPVVIHTFAVWCSACLMQLRETERLLATDTEAFTVIGIDLDPNENQNIVKRHIEKNKFPGRYAAAPKEMSASLIETFGKNFFTDLPQTVIICNRTVTKMGTDGGLFSEKTLYNALSELCG